MLGLYVVEGVAAVDLRARTAVVGAVGSIESVPVDLSVLLRGLPPVDRALPLREGEVCVTHITAPDIEIATRQVLPIVGLRVLSIAVVEFRTLVHAVLSEGRGREFQLVADIPVPGEDGRGREVVDDAAVTLLAVLITPVGIVVIIIGEPVGLIRGSTL